MISFDLQPETLVERLSVLLQQHQQAIDTLLKQTTAWTYDSLIQPLERLSDELQRFWSPVSHLNSVKSDPALREAYNQGLTKLSAYSTWLSQNEALYQAMQQLKASPEFAHYSIAQQSYIEHELRDFQLAGIALSATDKAIYAELQQQLAQLTAQFEEHLLDATDAWQYLVSDTQALRGVPETVLANLREAAAQKNQVGYLLTLQGPCFQAIMTYADDAALRQRLYTAYVTRASDLGPSQWDNSEVMVAILSLRQRLAQLLGFNHYTDYALATRMASSSQEVEDFLQRLLTAAKAFAEKDMQALSAFAKQQGLTQALAPWDIAYYSEKLKQATFAIDEEQLRVYFPIHRVLEGLFTICQRLYGISIRLCADQATWHPDVQVYQIEDHAQQTIAYFYMDLYAREKKRGGAWMDDAQSLWQDQLPIAYLTCNFMPASQDKPALLTHEDVVTLFHEFGHGLHHMLTQVKVLGVSGIHGVAWDAVELPSQFLENWCWQKEALALISGHYQSGEALPDDLLQALLNAKNFQAGLFLVRQLEFALFDWRLHQQFDPSLGYQQIQRCLNDVRARCCVTPIAEFNRFQHSFSHVFAGGYAAGYYSYLWAEVLAQDAFGRFLEEGIFNAHTGEAFKRCILARGGSEPMAKLFQDFRGRAPEVKALLHSYGLA